MADAAATTATASSEEPRAEQKPKQPEVDSKPTDWSLLKRLGPFVAPFKWAFVTALVLNVAEVASVLAQPLLLRVGIDYHVATLDLAELPQLAGFFLAVVMVGFIARALGIYWISAAGLKVLASMRGHIYDHVTGQGQRFFDRRTTGSLMTRTTTDVEAIQETLMMGAVSLVTDALTITGIFVTMLLLDWKLTLVSFALSPAIFIVVNLFRKKLRELSLIIRRSLSRLNGFFAEQIYGMSVVQLYGAEEHTEDTFRSLSFRFLDAYRRSNWWDAGLYAVMDGLSAVSVGLMLWFGASAFTEPGSAVTLGLLIAFVDYLRRIYIPIREFSGRLASIQRAVAALERIFGLLDANDRVGEGTVPLPAPEGSVRLEGVNFRYAEDRPEVLHGVSLAMNRGEVVALVGATGSGKTTIGKVLTRMYDGYEGSITMDGVELRDILLDDLRRAITVVHQDVYLFNASIRDNIGLWDPAIDDAQLERAVDLARARALIEDHPQGLDRVIAERGQNLSSGQKQLLAIARAMARDAPIVILDEATASVDSVTEKLIDEAIEELLSRKTVLVIAHRLSTIMKADRIVVLHHGEVVEHGSHDELMALDGRYKHLVETGFASGTQAG